MDDQVFPPDALVKTLQLSSEVAPLDIEVKHPGVVHQHAGGPVCQVGGRLPENLVQHGPVCVGKHKELLKDKDLMVAACAIFKIFKISIMYSNIKWIANVNLMFLKTVNFQCIPCWRGIRTNCAREVEV